MNRPAIAVVALLLVGVPLPSFGETAGEKAFRSYAEFAVGGVWVCEIDGEVLEDRYERILDGRFVQQSSQGAGEVPSQVMTLGVDPVTKECTWWGFSTDGTVTRGTMTQESERVWIGKWKGEGPNGSGRATGRLTKIDGDTIKFEILEQEVEGETKEYPAETIWNRKRTAEEKLDRSGLIGKWKYVSGQKDGEDLDAAHFEGQSVEIDKETFTLMSGEKFVMTYEINAAKTPAVVNFTITESPFGAGAKAAGIIALVDGELHVCYSPMGAPPPTRFQAKAGSGHFMFVLQRR